MLTVSFLKAFSLEKSLCAPFSCSSRVFLETQVLVSPSWVITLNNMMPEKILVSVFPDELWRTWKRSCPERMANGLLKVLDGSNTLSH